MIAREDFHSTFTLLRRSNELVLQLLQSSNGVDLVVANQDQVDVRKADFARIAPLGVSIQTYDHWLMGQWDLFGDGSRIVDATTRRVLLRPIMTEVFGISPSKSYLADLCSFVEEATGLDFPEDTSAEEQQVAEVLQRYGQRLAELSLVEQAQAEQVLAANAEFMGPIVLEMPGYLPKHTLSFLEDISGVALVTVLSRSLDAHFAHQGKSTWEVNQLRYGLYRNANGLQAQGNVVAGEVHGAHQESAMVVEMLKRFHRPGVNWRDIALVVSGPEEITPGLLDALAQNQIPFAVRYSVPLHTAAFGSAYIALERIRRAEELIEAGVEFLPDTYLDMLTLLQSPYSGVSAYDAAALQIRWRRQAHSTHQERMKDIRMGFKGNGKRTIWNEKLRNFKPLLNLENDLASCVRRMMANKMLSLDEEADVFVLQQGEGAFQFSEGMEDDCAAANSVISYLQVCQAVGQPSTLWDKDELSCELARAYGDESDALVICDPDTAQYLSLPCIIMANLDVDHYSMAGATGPFDTLLKKIGAYKQREMANEQRLRLLGVLGAAQQSFGFYRVCHNAMGEETCQSALWDELVSPYRTKADEDGDRPIHVLPLALVEAGATIVSSEGDIFHDEAFETTAVAESVRGQLERGASLDILPMDYADYGETYSPTALESYYRCPYNWFITKKVGGSTIDAGFEASDKGNLAHDVLEKFYLALQEQGHQRVTRENLDFSLELLGRVFAEQVESQREKGKLFLCTEAQKLECDQILPQLEEFLKRDVDFLPGYAPAFMELKFSDKENPYCYAGVPVSGKVDRVDMDGEGHAIIIDYKLSGLGSGYGRNKAGEMPTRIQTDIYATLLQEYFRRQGQDVEVLGSVYRSYYKNNLRGIYCDQVQWGPSEKVELEKDAMPHTAYTQYLGEVEAMVKERLSHLQEGEIAPDPIEKGMCTYCPAKNCERRC